MTDLFKGELPIIDPDFTAKCVRLEHYETPIWAAEKILEHEILTPIVFDPCAGTGVLAEAAKRAGYKVFSNDIENWGYETTYAYDFLRLHDYLTGANIRNKTIFMNPPFSKAVEFVEQGLRLKARKIVCFQRMSWFESQDRRSFWRENPPNRIYICGDRATCWRHDLTQEQRDEKGGTTTAHAWFIWEKGQPAGPLMGHIFK